MQLVLIPSIARLFQSPSLHHTLLFIVIRTPHLPLSRLGGQNKLESPPQTIMLHIYGGDQEHGASLHSVSSWTVDLGLG